MSTTETQISDDVLASIGSRLRTQDNRCTTDPMFCVQERKLQYGLDPNYCDGDNYHWLSDDGDHVQADEAGSKHLDACDREGEPTLVHGEPYEKFYYFEHWETVMVAFTEEGCKEYMRLNGHNHRGELQIYVESFRRCPEMLAIREWLMGKI